MPRPDEGLIHQWLDGECTPEESARIERLVAEDPEWAAAVAEARGLMAASSRILSALDAVPHALPSDTASPAAGGGATGAGAEHAKRGRTRVPAWIGLAASVVLVAGTAYVLRDGSRAPVGTGAEARQEPAAPAAAPAAPSPAPAAVERDVAEEALAASVTARSTPAMPSPAPDPANTAPVAARVAAGASAPLLAQERRGASRDVIRASPRVTVQFDSLASAIDAPTRALIERIAQQALRDIAEVLPGTPDSVMLRVIVSPMVIPETGEGARTPEPHEIEWTVRPATPDSVRLIVQQRLRKTLFHEVHHLARGWTLRGGRPLRGLADALVAEGLASVFARSFAADTAPWSRYPTEAPAWAREVIALPPSALAQYNQWMFQHPDGRRWIGYRAGTWVAEQAVQRSGRSAASLAMVSTDSILSLAGLRDERD